MNTHSAIISLLVLFITLGCGFGGNSSKGDSPSVEAELVGWSMGKPPLNALKLNVVFRNPSKKALWFIIEDSFYVPAQEGQEIEGVSGVAFHPLRDGEKHCGVVAIQTSLPSFSAVQVEGGGQVEVDSLLMEAWGDFDPSAFNLNITAADEIQVDGKPVGKLFSDPVRCSVGAKGHFVKHDYSSGLDLPMGEYRSWSFDNPREISTQVTFESHEAIFGKGWGDSP